jgi:hypothetical protein
MQQLGVSFTTLSLEDLISDEETCMHVRFTAENIFLVTRQYKNYAEVITLIAKRQDFHQVILKNGIRIESPGGLKYLMNDIFFRKVYNPAHLHIGTNDIVVDIGSHHGV